MFTFAFCCNTHLVEVCFKTEAINRMISHTQPNSLFFHINHHKGALYQPYSGKLNLQSNISIIAVFLFSDTNIYLAVESSTAEPANSERPETMEQ